jgi:hypothetical protein
MNKRIFFSILILPLIVMACGILDKATEESSNIANIKSVFMIPTDPVVVMPTLENGNQTEAVIPVSGGSISVKGGDGTVFRLDIPADALIMDTRIIMTPISHLEGMPFGSDPRAVQMEPNGLQFNSFVTLTITPAQPIPVDQQIFFDYHGDNNQLAIALPVVGSQEVQILLDHFSGSGVTKGLLADIEPVRKRIGGDAETRIRSTVSEALLLERQIQLKGGESNDSLNKKFEKYFKEYEEQVIKPRVAAAGESCAAGRLALQTVLGNERQIQLLGGEGDGLGPSNFAGLMDTVSNVCMKEEYELCKNDHVITRIIPVWLGLERQFQLLGSKGDASSKVLQNARDLVTKCLSFELVFQSQATFDDEFGGYTSSVNSTVKMQFNTDNLKMSGQAPLVNTTFDYRLDGCSVTSNRGGDTFEAIDLAYIPQENIPEGEVGKVIDFVLSYFPGNTTESYTIQCEGQPVFTSPPSFLWTGIFMDTHELELDQVSGFVMKDWEVFGNEYFAKKEWITEDAEVGLVEAGTFKLYHRPK